MPKPDVRLSLKNYDDIFSTQEEREAKKAAEGVETVQQVKLSELVPFKNHPFKVRDDEDMEKTVESIEEFGVLNPVIVRPVESGGYEIVSGHRRCHAAELAGLKTVPAIVRDLDDDAATILMVDSNLQRETILPSERAWAFKMKYDAVKHQGHRKDLTSTQVGQKLKWTLMQVADESNTSKTQVQRYIALTNLIPELLEMVDNRQLAFNPAVELSYIPQYQQERFLEAMDYAQSTPSLSQAQRIKKLSQDGKCTLEAMCAVMDEEKKPEQDHITIKHDVLRKYFPKDYTPRQMEAQILKLLDQWQKKKELCR